MTWFGPGPGLVDQAGHWAARVRIARQQAQVLPYYLEVRYEDLVRDPPTVLRPICDFIELPYDPVMKDPSSRAAERLGSSGIASTPDERRGYRGSACSGAIPARCCRPILEGLADGAPGWARRSAVPSKASPERPCATSRTKLRRSKPVTMTRLPYAHNWTRHASSSGNTARHSPAWSNGSSTATVRCGNGRPTG